MVKQSLKDFQIFAKPVSYRCNLACHYCYYLRTEDQLRHDSSPPLMNDEILTTYLSQHIAACPGDRVNFSWHGGEPMIAGVEFYRRVVALQKKYNISGKKITNGIQTNGTLIDDDWGRFFAEHNFAVGISIDGPQDLHDVYRRSRHNAGTHKEVMRGWELLCKYNIPADILCVVNEANVLYPLQVYRHLKDIGGKYISFLPLVELKRGGTGKEVTSRSVQAEHFGAFLCTIFDEWLARDIGAVKVQIFEEAARTAFRQEHSLCLFRPVCGDIPVLESNGDLYCCDHFVGTDYCLGNIADSPLEESLSGPLLTGFGAAKQHHLPRMCRECEVLAMCNGECPKNRFVKVPGEVDKVNYLCAGYRMFFNHCRPFVEAVASRWEQQSDKKTPKTGRNDPCPCGSRKKYKRCCLKK
ncbi:MAG: anaerobic sulfatase maturase [Desulforhopalus sp.]